MEATCQFIRGVAGVIGILALMLLGSGCIAGLANFSRPDNLTPEQIEAYNKGGFDVYGCFQVAGPPPAGGMTYIIAPKGSKPSVRFGLNCQPIDASISGGLSGSIK